MRLPVQSQPSCGHAAGKLRNMAASSILGSVIRAGSLNGTSTDTTERAVTAFNDRRVVMDGVPHTGRFSEDASHEGTTLVTVPARADPHRFDPFCDGILPLRMALCLRSSARRRTSHGFW